MSECEDMTEHEFNQWIIGCGKDILCFCRMTTGDKTEGDELYQDTMLKLWEQRANLHIEQNIKSYALSVAINTWKNRRRKFAWRRRLAPFISFEERMEHGEIPEPVENSLHNPETQILRGEMIQMVRKAVCELPEKYCTVIHLYYSADMKIHEIAECLSLSESTVKSRMRKAKKLLKNKLEAMEYDG